MIAEQSTGENAADGLADLPEIYREIAEIIGMEAARKMAEHFGGCQVYFPYWDSRKIRRDRAIMADRDSGMDPAALARKYGLSERRIRDILESGRAEKIENGKQKLLFEDES